MGSADPEHCSATAKLSRAISDGMVGVPMLEYKAAWCREVIAEPVPLYSRNIAPYYGAQEAAQRPPGHISLQ